jgi:anthranilate phosphoribosyltransferase
LMNCLGPLLNPVGARNQVVGVYNGALVEPLASALVGLGSVRALVVHGSDGLDEITLTGPTRACFVGEGEPRGFEIDPTEFGFSLAPPEALIGGSPKENAVTLRAILDGEQGALRNIVLMNAGAAIWVAGMGSDLAEGIELAKESLDRGAARDKLAQLVHASNETGGST